MKHAFALPQEIYSDEELALLDKGADIIVKRRMEVPAVMFLQTLTPVGYIGSQVMIALKPFLGNSLKEGEYDMMTGIFERRGACDVFIKRIERKVAQRDEREGS